MKWYYYSMAFVVSLVSGMLIGAVYVKAEYDLPKGQTPMKAFIEDYGLNLLGDTLAGLLGLATFLVVLFTYVAQKALAKRTIEQMEQQNQLSGKIANANYMLALHDKRLKAYHHFIDARNKFLINDSRDPEIIKAFGNAVAEAEFVYDVSVNKRLRGLADDASTLHMIALRLERLQIEKDNNQWSNHKETEQQQAYADFADLSGNIFDVLRSQQMREAFDKHLMLPTTIVSELDETATKQ
ncbi:hypothetical protein [Agrobacterium rosae]|uniref:hypothetical protein n=1 Tax=Agrobacterium rosae TaxID=1972867 RepID=UPI000CD81726|nr:hypothetical protein [Agrobacterium rosae]POO56267.1 hypothetical protein CTT39_05905 [Agrobacterium rosae]